MTVMYKVTIDWTGFTGAPGFTNLYATTTDPLQAGLDTFVAGVNTLLTTWRIPLSNNTTTQVRGEVELIEDTDGSLVNIMTATTPPSAAPGGQSAGNTACTGLVVNWLTSGAVLGRRRQGRSYVVPIATNILDTDGTINSAGLGAQRTAANVYAAATTFHPVVWVRPVKADPTHVPPIAARAGATAPINAARIPDKAAVLRSRRD